MLCGRKLCSLLAAYLIKFDRRRVFGGSHNNDRGRIAAGQLRKGGVYRGTLPKDHWKSFLIFINDCDIPLKCCGLRLRLKDINMNIVGGATGYWTG